MALKQAVKKTINTIDAPIRDVLHDRLLARSERPVEPVPGTAFIVERDVIASGSVLMRRDDKTLVDRYFWNKIWAQVDLKTVNYTKCLLAASRKPRHVIDNVVVLYHPFMGNYHHFVFETLARLRYHQTLLEQLGEDYRFFVGRKQKPRQWQDDYLRYAGFDKSKFLDTSTPVDIKRLYVLAPDVIFLDIEMPDG
ncbi:MAG: glycosyltransferase family 61 protein, partial [Caulobacterales bacterium]|nr:glycosyltransferase family 61 protein [Caulobacterales bacterium]